MNPRAQFRGPAVPLAERPLCDGTFPVVSPDPVATHSVHDYDIGDVVGRVPDITLRHLRVVAHQSMETDCAAAILGAAAPGAPADGSLRVVGTHPEEGLVAMGAEGRILHIVQITDL